MYINNQHIGIRNYRATFYRHNGNHDQNNEHPQTYTNNERLQTKRRESHHTAITVHPTKPEHDTLQRRHHTRRLQPTPSIMEPPPIPRTGQPS